MRYSASASDGLPVFDSSQPRFVVAFARLLRNSVTAGLSSASFCWIASALRNSVSASDGLPVSDSRLPRLWWLIRQVAAEFGDGGVVVGQLLVDRQRLAVLGLRFRRLARLRQQDAEVVVAAARWLRNSVTAGLSSASFCRIASALRYSASASDGLPVSASRTADAVDRVRQVAPGLGRRPGGGGQRLLIGPRQAVDRQRIVVAARGVEQPAETRPAVRQDGPHRGGLRDRRGQLDQQGLRLAVRRLGLVGLAGRLQQTGDGRQAAPDVGLDLQVGRRFGRQRLAGGEDLPVSRQRVLLLADLVRQVGQLEVRLPQRPPRGQVRLLAQQGTELAVEVAGRLQQPVAQVLELLLLEQEVLADAGVKRLDRVRRQLVPPAARTRLGELAVGFVQPRSRLAG